MRLPVQPVGGISHFIYMRYMDVEDTIRRCLRSLSTYASG